MKEQIKNLINDLKSEILGYFIAEVVSRRKLNLPNQSIARVSNYELIVLAILYDKGGQLDKNTLRRELEPFPGVPIVFEHIISHLERLKLVKVSGGSIQITEKGESLIDEAMQVRSSVERAIKEDSFFGWMYREEKKI